jgi:hypothetical protein
VPGPVPRWKEIRCRTCGETIRRFDRSRYAGHVPAEVILAATRKHYKEHHPGKFRASIRKGVKTRMSKKKRTSGKKWGKIGAPHSAKRKKWLAHLRRMR